METLHFFNGQYMDYFLKFEIETVGLRIFKKRLRILQNIV